MVKLGIIGGSGLYAMDGLTNVTEVAVDTPFGAPSEVFVRGELAGVECYFLPRHGRGHRLLPQELNHRANLYAFKVLGVEQILSISAVGSFREEMAPGDVVLVDQFVDRTKRSADHTFFGDGCVAHIGFAHPTCDRLRNTLAAVIDEVLATDNPHGCHLHERGTYLNMEGPAFSTLAESRLYRAWGLDVIGMTNLAEAKLAREAEMCYLTLAMVTDYDCWHETHATVSVEMIIATLLRNAELAKQVIRTAASRLAHPAPECPCRHALKNAIITQPSAIPPATRQRLAPLVAKYFGQA
jgi:5'-methylthioadenosine phosphorylase